MRGYLIDFLRSLEALVPPPAGGHHAITFAQHGDPGGRSERLALHVNQGGALRCLFLDDEDFDQSPEGLAAVTAAMLRRKPPAREQTGVGFGQYLL